jgi:arylsulfatase A-like enzyme
MAVTMTERAAAGEVVTPPAGRVSGADLLIMTATVALVTSLVELALLAVAKFGLGRFMHLNPQIVWLAPVTYTLLFLVVAGLVYVVLRGHSRVTVVRVAMFLCTWMGGAGVLFLHQRLHKGAALLVAAGVATQASWLVVRYAPFFVRWSRRLILPLAAMVPLLFLGLNGRWLWLERRALAALPESAQGAPNVLLIIWDTVRAASLSLYGYERETTPTLERLANEGVAFERAYSTAPWTAPAHASLFTGRWTPELSADWAASLDDEHPVLAEVLAAQGYRTAGFTANTFATARESGLARGFSHYDDYHMWSPGEMLRSTSLLRAVVNRQKWRHALRLDQPLGRKHAPQVEREFLNWLDRDRNRPFFAFLNVFDAHGPYLPPAPFDTLFGPKLEGRNPTMLEGRQYTPREVQAELDAYEGGIAWVDYRLGILLDELERRGVLRNTLVVITSDHGEEFGEHGLFTHGHGLYERVLHVPLLMHYPARLPRGQRVSRWVSLRDVPATILAVLGHTGALPGESLLRPDTVANTVVDTLLATVNRASGNPPEYPVSRGDMRALYADPWKLIVNGDGEREMYELRMDPNESTDLSASPDAAAARAALEAVLERMAPAHHRSRR